MLTPPFKYPTEEVAVRKKQSCRYYSPSLKMGHPDLSFLLLGGALFPRSPFLFVVFSSPAPPVFWLAPGTRAAPARASRARCAPSPHALHGWKHTQNLLATQIPLLCCMHTRVTPYNLSPLPFDAIKINSKKYKHFICVQLPQNVFSGSLLTQKQ